MSYANGGKRGRPANNDQSGRMRPITFRADEATEKALEDLEAALVDGSVLYGRRSALMRRLILDAHARLKEPDAT